MPPLAPFGSDGKQEIGKGKWELVSDSFHPTQNSEFPRRKVGGVALNLHFLTGKYQKQMAFPMGNSKFLVG